MSSGRKKAFGSGKKRRVGSWADWAARRPLGIELPKRLTRLKPGRIGYSPGGSGGNPATTKARCAVCPQGGCAGCPVRRR